MATMEPGLPRSYNRGSRPNGHIEGGTGRRAHHGNKRWVADGVSGRSGASTSQAGSDSERWERGGHRGGARGRGRGARGRFGNATATFRRNGALDGGTTGSEGEHSEMEDEHEVENADTNEPETPEERENFWQELVKAREAERKKAIAEGKMDDPSVAKRLEDAITMVGTCMDMCPRFERYRRERENSLFEWETIPGTKRVDHKRAVKAYERAAGDKTLPSDLRPPDVLKRTLDYLFHELLPQSGFLETFNFIRDRSRAVRTDFTMQHEMGAVAIECHDRCARFHILALHAERDRPGFSVALEEQQLMNTLQSLKEFYHDQRDHYQSPTELEMRVYHRLIHIRDQKERYDDIPGSLLNHPVFELTTKFRARVQAKSAPITKTSALVVDPEAMQIFGELANVLRREGNVVMTYLVACILERHFGKDTIEDIELIRSGLSIPDIVDGYSGMGPQEQDTDIDISVLDETEDQPEQPVHTAHQSSRPLQPSGTQWLTDTFGPKPTPSAFFKSETAGQPFQPSVAPIQSAFSNLKTAPNVFGTTAFSAQSAFANVPSTPPSVSAFGTIKDGFAPAPSSFLQNVTEAAVSFSTPPSVSFFSAFNPQPDGVPTTSTLRAEQSSQIAEQSPQQRSPEASEVTPGGTKKSIFGGESPLSKPLNPLAPIFTPKPNLDSPSDRSGPSAPIASVFNTMSSTFKESPTSIPPRPEQTVADISASEIPSMSSSLPINSTSMEDAMDQTPPTYPPPLYRSRPISLPPTPTASIYIPPSFPSARIASVRLLPLPSISGPLRRGSTESRLKIEITATDVEAESESSSVEKLNTTLVTAPPPTEKPSLDIMKATSLHFARGGWLVRSAFSKWRQRLGNHAKWLEACQRSTNYKEKAQAERLSRSIGGHPATNGHAHRETSSERRTPLKKRLRERLSGEYRPPANDDELVRRFEKNHEDHTRRWARGSFLGILREFLESMRSPFLDNWSVWLSLNQESDGTAIWLEQKFDVPASGHWKNENVFQIPISKDHVDSAAWHPGIVVFERTPLTDVADLLGRKYRVLEDCTRLREIIEAFPLNRHYVPSLLCIGWSERDPDASKDFDDMVESMVAGGMLTSTHEVLISTAALDVEPKLRESLHSIPFDLEGRLVKRVSLNDLFSDWEHQWEEMATRWLGNCVVYGDFNWDLYGKLLEGCTRLFAQIVDCMTSLLREDGVPSDIPHLQLVKTMDSNTTFDAVLDWLWALPETGFTALLTDDIKAHRDLGRDFPTMTFLSQLYALTRPIAAHAADVDPEVMHFLSRSRLDEESKKVRALVTTFEEEMRGFHFAKLKPSKRLASFADSSSSRLSTPRSKKQRLSVSDDSPTDEETTSGSPTSPPLSVATSVPPEPAHQIIQVITPAMLRSLTKDIRAKYGTAPTNTLSASVSR
ncbi:SAC3/GANP/Nin1/mts3/eIF-3 p25 family-domain-containing protein [Chiua virens]|nr:SAC3/GANP/Nin1/mts3/eIF-3 p25 family-domain-containing protein [Chiua virens]